MNQDQNINPEEALAAVFGEPKQIAEDITAFGDVIYSYTRAQAVADGVQVEVTKTAQEARTPPLSARRPSPTASAKSAKPSNPATSHDDTLSASIGERVG